MIFRPFDPNAGPTGGDGFAAPSFNLQFNKTTKFVFAN